MVSIIIHLAAGISAIMQRVAHSNCPRIWAFSFMIVSHGERPPNRFRLLGQKHVWTWHHEYLTMTQVHFVTSNINTGHWSGCGNNDEKFRSTRSHHRLQLVDVRNLVTLCSVGVSSARFMFRLFRFMVVDSHAVNYGFMGINNLRIGLGQ